MTNPLDVFCPACQAHPGKPCTRPTNNSRVEVKWFHLAREDYAQYGEEDET